jgi:hypothetical protein
MKIAVLDLETDPFETGLMVAPFLAGYYDGSKFIMIWASDCISKMVEALENENEKCVIYAHNGGRFDFFFFLPHLATAEMTIINGRIVKAHMAGHEIRDSYALMPFPLSDYEKDVIDYEMMRACRRERFRDEILKYLRKDLTSLYELCVAFHREFGDKLTIGSTSMGELKKRHKFSCGGKPYDEKFRTDFFFGGRNQVFKSGITKGDIRVYDVNSMYPYVMSQMLHPVGVRHDVTRNVTNDTCFVTTEGRNFGAFPIRAKNGSLDFTVERGRFCCTIHEWEAALETGCFRPDRVVKAYSWRERASFSTFVEHFYQARKEAKASGDKILALFYKYVLNSAYGKFAQNPENYFDWSLHKYGEYPAEWHNCTPGCPVPCPKEWVPDYIHGDYIIWKRPLQSLFYYNVATGASITGAARAVLMRGIAAARRPLYCDTDSLITDGPVDLPLSDTELGAWKIEGTGNVVAIAGKKMYAVWDGSGCCVKKAHKGVRLKPSEIWRIARGGSVEVANPVPHFSFDGTWGFTKRVVRRTGSVV